MDIYDFYRLFQLHGGYALPSLVEIKFPDLGSLYFTNNQTDVVFENTVYKAVAMAYNPPSTQDGIQSGGSLEIDIESSYQDLQGGSIINFLDNADERIELVIKAVILEDQHIKKISQLTHKYGSASWDGERVVWNLGGDDRLQMTINPWALDSVSLTG
jgi:predicted RNase H-like HicB family nuclease